MRAKSPRKPLPPSNRPAVRLNILSGDPMGSVAGQQRRHIGDILRLPELEP